MILYRLTKTRYLSTAWTGTGAKEAGGRWNSPGTAMVYASETASLTMLETLVHLHTPQLLDIFSLLRIAVPDELVMRADITALPPDWSREEAPSELPVYGDTWVASLASVGLLVPSALSPVEFNCLLNPEHAAFPDITRRAEEIPFRFDTRLRMS